YWGPNLARNFAAHPDAQLAMIADQSPRRLEAAHAAYSWSRLTGDAMEVITDPELDIVIIATPPETHRDLAIAAMEHGKHVLVEKPLATSTADAEEMVRVAKRTGRTLMVDHTFLFTGAVRRMKTCIDAGELGHINYFDSTRINLGLFQSHVNVVWDLAPHDIAIMLHLLPGPVRTVAAVGASHVNSKVENIAYITFGFDGNLLAHLHVNWLSPVKIRKTIIGGTRRMLVYDDMETSEKLKIFDAGADLTRTPEAAYDTYVSYRTGDVLIPRLDPTEALAAETSHFLAAVRGKEQLISGGELGVEVVRVIEAAERSMRSGGAPVEVSR
ncbi:MAG: Gfo/Idh/MocA family protein, partial [Dehalococcoidia bacterium]